MSMIAYLALTGVMSVASSAMQNKQAADNANKQRDAKALSDSAASKAEGTETIMENKRSTEEATSKLRQSLQLQGATTAAADSAGIGGQSADDITATVEFQGEQAMTMARDSAKSKRNINRMSNKSRYDSALYSTESFEVGTLGQALVVAGMKTASTYLGAKAGGGS